MVANFVDIPTAMTTMGYVSVVGVVVDVFGGGVMGTKGTSLCITFTLKDKNINNGHTWDGLKIKYFNENSKSIPHVNVGDLVALRGIRVRLYNGKATGVASQIESISWVIFRSGKDPLSTPAITGPVPFEASALEKRHASKLMREANGATCFRSPTSNQVQGSQVMPSPTPAGSVPIRKGYSHRPFLLIKDAQERMFVDLVVQVVKTFTNDFEKAVILVTDYTTNETLLDYGHDGDNDSGRDGDPHNYLGAQKRKWKGGPSGRMTLKVTLWEPHASYVRESLKLNDLVSLSNVNIKRSRITHELEASIHTDRMYPEKVGIRTLDAEDDDRVRDLLRRKREYWKANGGKDTMREEIGQGKGTKKPKKNNQQKKQEAKKEEGQKPLSLPKRTIKLNPSIKTTNPAVNPRSLEAIISNESHQNSSPDGIEYRLPFQNICFRAQVRVVDFFPPKLEDFAVPIDPEYSVLTSDESDGELDNGSHGKPIKWEWRFCLLVESAPPPPPGQPKELMRLFVTGMDAIYLLKIDAVDLRRHKKTLNQLKEKLFLIWGNLEEEKRKSPEKGDFNPELGSVSRVPFTCCIKEYGVKCTHESSPHRMEIDNGLPCDYDGCFGWERRFAMFETTIHD